MNCLDPTGSQYAFGRNVTIRDGKPTTRPGTRRRWALLAGATTLGFWFNEDAARYNDPTHNGFWFPFEFAVSLVAGVQGIGTFRFAGETETSIIFVTAGTVYRHVKGFAEEVATSVALGVDETITFMQAVDYLYMFRGEDLDPLRWDGTSTGFEAVPAAAVGDDMPLASRGFFHNAGRIWLWRDRDDVYASDILDPTEWDLTAQAFSVKSGDGDEITALVPFRENTLLVCKRRSITALTGINAVYDPAVNDLTEYVAAVAVESEIGVLGPQAWAVVGEDFHWLGYGGIYSLRRNAENRIERQPVAMSAPVQSYIERINWEAASGAAAVVYDNYLLWAVPLDGASVNNAVLVLDLLAPAGSGMLGAWCGAWDAPGMVLSVAQWLPFNDELLYLTSTGILRKAFCDCSQDSDVPLSDTAEWDASAAYKVGDIVKYEEGGSTDVYLALRAGTNHAPTDTDYWEAADDTQHAYDVQFELRTGQYRAGPHRPGLRMGRGELLFQGQALRVTLQLFGPDHETEVEVHSAIEYAQTEYDTVRADWDIDVEDEANEPHRQDYAVQVPDEGMIMGPAGWYLNVWRTHNLRFIRQLLGDRTFGVRILNDRGRLRVLNFAMPVQTRRHAARKVV